MTTYYYCNLYFFQKTIIWCRTIYCFCSNKPNILLQFLLSSDTLFCYLHQIYSIIFFSGIQHIPNILSPFSYYIFGQYNVITDLLSFFNHLKFFALQDESVITLRDLKGGKLSGSVFNILFNLNKFMAFETRDPFLIRQVHEIFDKIYCILELVCMLGYCQ